MIVLIHAIHQVQVWKEFGLDWDKGDADDQGGGGGEEPATEPGGWVTGQVEVSGTTGTSPTAESGGKGIKQHRYAILQLVGSAFCIMLWVSLCIRCLCTRWIVTSTRYIIIF